MQEQARAGKTAIIAASMVGLAFWLSLASGKIVRVYRNLSPAAMEPTLRIGESLVVRPAKVIARGDLVVFRHPDDPKAIFVKRAVAIAGDLVEVRDKQCFINGQAAAEPYVMHIDPTIYPKLSEMPEPWKSRDQFGPYRVPPDHVFVLGDNRDRSHDSRYWGALEKSLIVGRVDATFTWLNGIRRIH